MSRIEAIKAARETYLTATAIADLLDDALDAGDTTVTDEWADAVKDQDAAAMALLAVTFAAVEHMADDEHRAAHALVMDRAETSDAVRLKAVRLAMSLDLATIA